MLTVVVALAIAMVKFDVVTLTDRESVMVTLKICEPETVGVPEMTPVAVLKLRPATKVPVSA